MSFYVASWYKGGKKPKFADDMERIWQARVWAAAENELLSGMVEAGFDGDTEFIPIFDYFDDQLKAYPKTAMKRKRGYCATEWRQTYMGNTGGYDAIFLKLSCR